MSKKNTKSIRIILFILLVLVTILIVTVTIFRVIDFNKNKAQDLKDEFDLEKSRPAVSGEENVEINGGLKTNISPKISEEKRFEDYLVSDIKLESNASGTRFSGKISNVSDKKIEENRIKVNFYDNNENIIGTMNKNIKAINSGETISFQMTTTSDYANAYQVEFLVIK